MNPRHLLSGCRRGQRTDPCLPHELPTPHPGVRANGNRRVGKEIPADIPTTNVTAKLRVVAERQANDPGAVAVIRNPPPSVGRHRQQRIEPDRELTERTRSASAACQLAVYRLAPGRGANSGLSL